MDACELQFLMMQRIYVREKTDNSKMKEMQLVRLSDAKQAKIIMISNAVQILILRGLIRVLGAMKQLMISRMITMDNTANWLALRQISKIGSISISLCFLSYKCSTITDPIVCAMATIIPSTLKELNPTIILKVSKVNLRKKRN